MTNVRFYLEISIGTGEKHKFRGITKTTVKRAIEYRFRSNKLLKVITNDAFGTTKLLKLKKITHNV